MGPRELEVAVHFLGHLNVHIGSKWFVHSRSVAGRPSILSLKVCLMCSELQSRRGPEPGPSPGLDEHGGDPAHQGRR